MSDLFTSDFFAGNRAKLRELCGAEVSIVVTANGLLQRGGDSTYPFHQDAYFWYLTGVTDPDIVLVVDGDDEFLIVPGRDSSRQAFDGAIDESTLLQHSGIKRIYDEKEGWQRLQDQLKQSKRVATLAAAPAYIEQQGFYTNPARARLVQAIKENQPDIDITDMSRQLVQLRVIKQAPELLAIRQAIDITIDTLKAVTEPAELEKFTQEYQVEAAISQGFRSRGADGHAFEPIVASGKRACTLHNIANNGPLDTGELLLLDVGAEVEHYAADITRTVALGAPTPRQQAVFDAAHDVQEYAKSLLKPGVIIREYERQIEQYMGKKLQELKLIKTVEHEAVRQYYPHATSHFMGLNVHDVGDYQQPLTPGMVLTVEPGIYIPEEGIGVRIEDDVLVTENGIEVLSERLPRTLGSPTIK